MLSLPDKGITVSVEGLEEHMGVAYLDIPGD